MNWNFCPKCGKELTNGWSYCPACGLAIGCFNVWQSAPFIGNPIWPVYPNSGSSGGFPPGTIISTISGIQE